MTAFVAAAALGVLASYLAFRARRAAEARRLASALGSTSPTDSPKGQGLVGRAPSLALASGASLRSTAPIVVASALLGAVCGSGLAGPPGAIAGAVIGACVPRGVSHRRAAAEAAQVDRQLSEFADAVGSAVRGGLSISQAVEFAAGEAEPPLRGPAGALLRRRKMGIPMAEALDGFADSVATDEAKLLALVLGVHHRSGGNVAAALEEIRSTIRHRLDLRRELRAMTAQGRISGVILGVLPVGFLVVLSVTSHRELSPVLHSPAGAALVSVGLALEGLAYLWIRRMLRVEV